MKVSENFDIREFVPKSIWDRCGKNSTWFVSRQVVELAQFYKDFFSEYYRANDNSGKEVEGVSIVINNWHYSSGGHQYRGFRPPKSTVGASLSQHRFCNAFDCDINIKYTDGTRKEADYKEIHKIIKENNDLFMSKGLTCVESVKDAPTWLHSDMRWIPDQKTILVVRYR